MYEFTYGDRIYCITDGMMEGIKLYVEEGIPPGGFLSAIISNDLKEAVGRADDVNMYNIPAFVSYFYNNTPSACWGSPEKMQNWIKSHQEKRELQEQESVKVGEQKDEESTN